MNDTKPRPLPPSKEEILLLEPFEGIGLERIAVISSPEQVDEALRELIDCAVLGFDTESRPTFHKDQKSTGPHVAQFATLDKAWVIQLHHEVCIRAVAQVLEERHVAKVGFGLDGDRSLLANRLGIVPDSLLDLDVVFKRAGYRGQVGVKSAIAITHNQRLQKSKSVATTNWASPALTSRQVLYAANDAYAAVCVHHALAKADARLRALGLSL